VTKLIYKSELKENQKLNSNNNNNNINNQNQLETPKRPNKNETRVTCNRRINQQQLNKSPIKAVTHAPICIFQ